MSRLIRLSEVVRERYIASGVTAFSIFVGVTHFSLHTFLINKYAGIFQLYTNGMEAEVPKELDDMLTNISDDLAIPIKNPVSTLFGVIGFDPTHFGSTLSSFGCIIGVPINLFYKNKSDIDHASISVGYKTVPWHSTDGQQLEDSLMMSDLAKKFAIANELAVANTPKMFFHCACAPITFLSCGLLNNYFYYKLNLSKCSTPLKTVFYVSLSTFGFGLFFVFKDLITQIYELEAQHMISNGGKDYILGGIEFYEKLIQKNKALRNLLPSGNSEYKTNGDPIYFFRNKHISPNDQKSYYVKKLNELDNNKNNNLVIEENNVLIS